MPEAKPKLPELLPMNSVPAMELDQFYPGERAVSMKACENFAKLYAADVQREAWNAAIEWAARECDAVAASCMVGDFADEKETADECAAAIRSAALPTTEGDTNE